MTGSGPAEKMGLKELEAHTRRSTFEEEKDSGRSGQVVSRVQFKERKAVRSNCAYTRVTYPNVCGPHRAMRGANINHGALYTRACAGYIAVARPLHVYCMHTQRDRGRARRRTRPLSVDRNDLSHVLVSCLSVPPFLRRSFVPPRSAFFLPPCSLPCSSSSLLRTQAPPSSPLDSYKKESCKE
ncbi:hypothetical protein ALC56_01880 [Trachymyrmex septentrionalis]|uniref:Uncharacterized protein n=1 Tax=Trachymyrmex septentrionalis TaxID=34720 RepID=A0A195FT37_9HYME|nr:hypothetical protein ALC56_01880 [Trachymyrmex septentrionalis]